MLKQFREWASGIVHSVESKLYSLLMTVWCFKSLGLISATVQYSRAIYVLSGQGWQDWHSKHPYSTETSFNVLLIYRRETLLLVLFEPSQSTTFTQYSFLLFELSSLFLLNSRRTMHHLL